MVLEMLPKWTKVILVIMLYGGVKVQALKGGKPDTNPTAVAVMLDGELRCSGTILTDSHILTDAYRVSGVDKESLTIIAGETNLAQADHQYSVKGRFQKYLVAEFLLF